MNRNELKRFLRSDEMKDVLEVVKKVARKTVIYEIKNTMSGECETVNTGRLTSEAVEANEVLRRYEERIRGIMNDGFTI